MQTDNGLAGRARYSEAKHLWVSATLSYISYAIEPLNYYPLITNLDYLISLADTTATDYGIFICFCAFSVVMGSKIAEFFSSYKVTIRNQLMITGLSSTLLLSIIPSCTSFVVLSILTFVRYSIGAIVGTGNVLINTAYHGDHAGVWLSRGWVMHNLVGIVYICIQLALPANPPATFYIFAGLSFLCVITFFFLPNIEYDVGLNDAISIEEETPIMPITITNNVDVDSNLILLEDGRNSTNSSINSNSNSKPSHKNKSGNNSSSLSNFHFIVLLFLASLASINTSIFIIGIEGFGKNVGLPGTTALLVMNIVAPISNKILVHIQNKFATNTESWYTIILLAMSASVLSFAVWANTFSLITFWIAVVVFSCTGFAFEVIMFDLQIRLTDFTPFSQSILSTALYIGYPISQGLYLILFQGTYNYHLPSAMLVCSFLMLLGALFQYSLLIRKDTVFTVL